MLDWLQKNWMPLALGLGVGAVVGFVAHPKVAPSGGPNLPPAPAPPVTSISTSASSPSTTSTSTPAGVFATVQPGQMTVSPTVGETVTLTLPTVTSPTGSTAQWVSGYLNGSSQKLSGDTPFSFQAPSAPMSLSIVWVDAYGRKHTTIVNVVPS